MDKVSVGATINIMMAAAMAEGKTIIENAAKEPHVVDVANFLNRMGANIRGAGTDVIRISGVEKLHKTEYSIIPDQIEAGTFMFAAAATHGDVTVKNVIPKHLEASHQIPDRHFPARMVPHNQNSTPDAHYRYAPLPGHHALGRSRPVPIQTCCRNGS